MMQSEAEDVAKKTTASDGSDWSQRRLCSDESCIGVIGPDGRCKECGQPYAGTLSATAATPPESPAADIAADPPAAAVEPFDDHEQWQDRRLCSDESCIGVIGPDGRCKECGRPFGG